MKRPSVLERWTLAGRLRARLEAIEVRVQDREVSRMGGGDQILSEVVHEIGEPGTEEERALVCDAHLARARLYAESRGATRLEAAQALVLSGELARELPPDPARASRTATLARRLLPELERAGSRRTRLQTLTVLLHAWLHAPPAPAAIVAAVRSIPPILHAFAPGRGDPGLAGLLDVLDALGDVPGAADATREVRREAASWFIAAGDASGALAVEEREPVLDEAGATGLALLLADDNRIDVPARRVFAAVLRRSPFARARLEVSLRRAAHIGFRTAALELEDREHLNLAILPFYREAEWPWRHLALAAAHRDDDETVVAAFAAAVDRGAETALLSAPAAAALFALGLTESARLLAGGEPESLPAGAPSDIWKACMTAGVLASRADPGPAGHACAEALDAMLRQRGLAPGREIRILRAQAALWRALHCWPEAARACERALSMNPRDPTVALDMAEICVAAGDTARARAFLGLAGDGADERRSALVRFRVHEEAGRIDEALAALEAALSQPRISGRDAGNRRAAVTRIRRRFAELRAGDPASSVYLRALGRDADGEPAPGDGDAADDGLRIRAAALAAALGDSAREAAHLLPLARRRDAPKDLVLRAARAMVRAGDGDRARLLIDRSRGGLARDPEAAVVLAALDLKEGRAAEARRRLELVAAGDDGAGVTVRLLLALSRAAAGDEAAALAAVAGTGEVLTDEARLAAWDLEATLLERAGRVTEALERRRRALEAGGAADARAAFARLALQQGLTRGITDPAARELVLTGLETAEGAADPAVLGLAARARVVLGGDPAAEAAAFLGLAVNEAKIGGDPGAMESHLSRAREVLPDTSEALPPLRVALGRLKGLLSTPSPANLSGLLRLRARSADDEDEALSMAEALAEAWPEPVAFHHLALAHQRRALARERDSDPAAFGDFERAHRAWQRLFDHPRALDHLRGCPVAPEVLAEAARALRRHIIDVHVQLAEACADRDPLRAEAHARLLLRSPLPGPEREQVRCQIFLSLTEAPHRSGDARALRHRLDIVLCADPENRDALRLLFNLETDAIAAVVAATPDGRIPPEALEELGDRAAVSSCAMLEVQTDAEACHRPDPDLERRLGLWHLAAAVTAAFRDRDHARAAREAAAARRRLLSGGSDPGASAEALLAVVEAAAPGGGVLSEAGDLAARGEGDRAEARLDSAYAAAVNTGDLAGARAAIELRSEFRRRREASREEVLVHVVQDHLVARRFRECLEMTGGRHPDPTNPLAVLVLRIQALCGLGKAERAAIEWEAIERRSRIEGSPIPEPPDLLSPAGVVPKSVLST